jgi:hypothetical protein
MGSGPTSWFHRRDRPSSCRDTNGYVADEEVRGRSRQYDEHPSIKRLHGSLLKMVMQAMSGYSDPHEGDIRIE